MFITFCNSLHCSGVSVSFRNAVTIELFIPRLCFSFGILLKFNKIFVVNPKVETFWIALPFHQ